MVMYPILVVMTTTALFRCNCSTMGRKVSNASSKWVKNRSIRCRCNSAALKPGTATKRPFSPRKPTRWYNDDDDDDDDDIEVEFPFPSVDGGCRNHRKT
eukprot:scaffold34939_cov280-Amphora_coffeaeformis.AAC.1